MRYDIRILNISFYGSGLSRTDSSFSGASARMCDYAASVRELIAIVPAAAGSESVVRHCDGFLVYPVRASGAFSFYYRAYRKAHELHTKERFDVLMSDNPHLGGVFGVWLGRKLGVPVVVHSMADMIKNVWYKRERISNRFKHLLMRYAARRADYIRVSTEREVERLKETHFGNRVRMIPFYIDVEAFREKLSQGVEAHTKTVLYVGRLGPQKDLRTLLSAFALVVRKIPDAKLVLVGDGPEREALTRFAQHLGISEQVRFTGAVPYSEVADYFSTVTVFAISSLYEGTCMVLHEAAAARLPLVTTDFAGAVDFIRDGEEGYVVPVRNHKAFAEALVKVLGDETHARALGARACDRLKNFSRESALSCWEALCSELSEHVHKKNTAKHI